MTLSQAMDIQPVPGLPEPDAAFDDVTSIAVLRGGGLGDLVFALPAIAALRATYPDATVTLLGSSSHRVLLDGRGIVDSVEILPPQEGVGDSRAPRDDAAVDRFVRRQRDRGFDLAVQVHGGGRNSNPFLLRLGARHTVGTRTPDAQALERTIPYVYYQHEVIRALEVVALAGAVSTGTGRLFEPSDDERGEAGLLLADFEGAGPLVIVHPGASDPRRRWPVGSFALLVSALVDDGCRVAIVGDVDDRPDAEQIAEQAGARGRPGRILVVAGDVGLAILPAVLERADVFVGNDSGPRHLAEAVGTRTSSVYWYGNVINAAPFGRSRHRVAISHTTRCPVCDVDITQVGWNAERCEHDSSVVAEVTVDEVLANTRALLQRS